VKDKTKFINKHKKSAETALLLEVDYGLSLILTCYVVLNDTNNIII